MPCPICEAGHRPQPVLLLQPEFDYPYILRVFPPVDKDIIAEMIELFKSEVKTYNTYKPPLGMIEGSYKNRKGRRYRNKGSK